MEFTELVSPTVAVPVLCVLVCAFFVFVFGFKSPAQPPNFNIFEDDRKKIKNKKSKGLKLKSNDNVVVTGDSDSNINNNVKLQTSSRQITKQLVKPHSIKSKTAAHSVILGSSKKVKSQSVNNTESKEMLLKPVQEDVDIEGWHTVPKKDKKQKKKDVEPHQVKYVEPVQKLQVPGLNQEELVTVTETLVTNVSDAAINSPASPQGQRHQRKKERKENKNKQDDLNVDPLQAGSYPEISIAMETNMTASTITSEVIDASIELQLQEAMDTTVVEAETLNDSKLKENKKDQKKSAAIEDDFVIPEATFKSVVGGQVIEPEFSTSLPLTENTEAVTVKVLKKKPPKDKKKKNDQGITDVVVKLAADVIHSSLPQPPLSRVNVVKEIILEPPSPINVSAKNDVAASMSENMGQPVPAASFDELDDLTESWTEAKPKSKKKKSRRAD